MNRASRTKPVILMIAISSFSIVVGVAAGMFIKSPAQREAEEAPPPITRLTEPVVKGAVEQTVSTGILIGHRNTTVVPVQAGDIITAISAQDRVDAGSLLLEVSGRPIVALKGQAPSFRDILPGAAGADVEQLIASLRSLGFETEETSFGPQAQGAFTEFYASLGYEPVRTGDAEAKQFAAQEDQANRSLREARTAVERAEVALKRARRPLSVGATPEERLARSDATEDAQAALDAARQARTDAESALADATQAAQNAKMAAGVRVPLGEVVFVPTFPAAAEVSAGLGTHVGGPVMTLVSGALVGVASLPTGEAGAISIGDPARILVDGSTPMQASVTAITETTQQAASQQQVPTVAVTLTPAEELPAASAGQEYRAVITVDSVDDVLHVPITALTTAADGTAQLAVLDSEDEVRTVTVETGFEGDGRVQVTPAQPDSLSEGDKVVIGG